MLDPESEQIVLRIATKAFETDKYRKALLDHEKRPKVLFERRKKPKEPLYGIQPSLMNGLLNLGDFETIEEFIEAANRLVIDYKP